MHTLGRWPCCVYPVKLKNLKANHNKSNVTHLYNVLCISCKVKKSESKSQPVHKDVAILLCCVYPVKLKNLKANHNSEFVNLLANLLCISCKVKKSESKSQHSEGSVDGFEGCVYPVKLKNLKANHN